jgi:tripeptide aminopeptidase
LIADICPMTSVVERFLQYVVIDTQSDATSSTLPSTEKQKDLGKLIVKQLQEMGIADAELDPLGYVYATIPATAGAEGEPTICFCAHMDTSPDCSGAGVKPIIHTNYQGQDIVMPDDTTVVLRPSQHPNLLKQIGHDIITASGTTLLGADNKCGVAAIMTAAEQILNNPSHKHGKIRILFTPDEEIGRGADHVDLHKLGADFAYTIDGEELGHIEDETWNADGAVLRFEGVSAHPGFAKGQMVNALKVAATFIDLLPKNDNSPESTEGREGFVHPVSITGGQEVVELQLILRDFTLEGLEQKRFLLDRLAHEAIRQYPESSFKLTISEQYRNMKAVLDLHPEVSQRAHNAMRKLGLEPERRSIRGGTDGARFTAMGLPCPNLFAGEHAFHGKTEWTSRQDMEAAVAVIVEVARAE